MPRVRDLPATAPPEFAPAPEVSHETQPEVGPLPPIVLQLPGGPELPNEFGIHVDVKLCPRQSTALRRLHAALLAQGAKLANGRPVTNTADTVRWLTEEIAGARAAASA